MTALDWVLVVAIVVCVAVTLSRPSGRLIEVNYSTADGNATASEDYTAASGTVTFAPGSVHSLRKATAERQRIFATPMVVGAVAWPALATPKRPGRSAPATRSRCPACCSTRSATSRSPPGPRTWSVRSTDRPIRR